MAIAFTIAPPARLSFALTLPEELPIELREYIAIGGAYYDGPYLVDPRFDPQTLATKEKRMHDDVTVNPIQVERTDNPQGGKTIYIGGMLHG